MLHVEAFLDEVANKGIPKEMIVCFFPKRQRKNTSPSQLQVPRLPHQPGLGRHLRQESETAMEVSSLVAGTQSLEPSSLLQGPCIVQLESELGVQPRQSDGGKDVFFFFFF